MTEGPIDKSAGLPESARFLAQRLASTSAAIEAVKKTDVVLTALRDAHTLKFMKGEISRFEQIARAARFTYDLPNAEVLHGMMAHANVFADAQKALKKFEAQFQLPEVQAAMHLSKQFDTSKFAKQFVLATAHTDQIKRAAEAMTAPWLKMQDQLRSFGAFAEIQGLGVALRKHATFAADFTDRLRTDLGDWRTEITWPKKVFEDVPTRRAFYIERGFKPQLTDLPTAAFDEVASLAGLSDELPGSSEDVNVIVKEEQGFRRTNQAHDRLQRFEARIREYIDVAMRDAFGEGWINERVADATRRQWERKRQSAQASGEPEKPLLAYAAFTDYARIFTYEDNWSIFEPVFQRKESITESLQRLVPIRNCTMHGRLITQDDMLYLYVEIMRILKAIGRWDEPA